MPPGRDRATVDRSGAGPTAPGSPRPRQRHGACRACRACRACCADGRHDGGAAVLHDLGVSGGRADAAVVPRVAARRRHGRRAAGGVELERRDDLVGVGAKPRVGRQRRAQQRHEARVDALEVDVTGADAGEHGVHAGAAERRTARRGIRDRGGPAPPVGGVGDGGTLDELGREVAGRAHDEPADGVAHVVLQVRDAEVDEDRVAVLDEDVARLDVAVDDAARVDGADRLGDAAGEAEQVGRGQRAVVLDDLVEGRAGHVAGHDVGAGRHDVGVDDARDPRVADAREGVDLTGQALPGVGVVRDVGAQHLDRDGAAARVEGEVDDAHAALADLLDEAVRADPLRGPRPAGASLPRARHRCARRAAGWAPARSGRTQSCPYGMRRRAPRQEPCGSEPRSVLVRRFCPVSPERQLLM